MIVENCFNLMITLCTVEKTAHNLNALSSKASMHLHQLLHVFVRKNYGCNAFLSSVFIG
jgi:ATP sulfurylase